MNEILPLQMKQIDKNKSKFIFIHFNIRTLMIENQLSHKAAHHQQSKVDLLEYENNLLSLRNQMLAAQNQRLLQRLDASINALHQRNTIQAGVLLQQKENINEKTKQYYHETLKGVSQKIKIIIGPQMKEYKQLLDSKESPLSQIFTILSKLITRLLQVMEQKKISETKTYINNVEQRLLSRRHARNKTQKIVHLIKEPSQELNSLNFRFLKEDLGQQKELFQKIVRRVKRVEVNSRNIDLLFEKIDSLMLIRWNMRKEYGILSLVERSFQLGQIDRDSHSNVLQRIENLKVTLQQLKKQFQENLQKLCTTSLR